MSPENAVYFSGSELLRVAVQLEKNGLAFYSAMARRSKDGVSQQVFLYLAEQEKKHRKVFEDMTRNAGNWPSDPMTEDYQAYLKALMRDFVFTSEKTARARAMQTEDRRQALAVGVQAEKDSILFYQEMRGLVRRTDRKTVGTIVNEERSHLAQLSALRREK